ncbi:MAG: glycosyltransferase [Candidatus Gastranaerophilales bacterium]|nr:glycosyltransferase [Candidatus Gastranaerophilales bacterium]
MDKLVSIIVTTYNRAEYLEECISSIINQTYKNIEILIIDDGSTDNTSDVVKKYFDSRIKYIYQENSGQNSAKNKGLLASNGQYITILDSDDMILPDKIEKQVEILESNEDVGLVYCGSFIINEKNEIIGQQKIKKHNGNVLNQLLRTNFLYNGSNALFRRDCIEKAGIFEDSINRMTDWFLYLKFAMYFDFYCLDEYLVKYRVHCNNMSCGFEKYEIAGFDILNKIFVHKKFPKKLLKFKNKYYALRYKYVADRFFENKLLKKARYYYIQTLKSDFRLISSDFLCVKFLLTFFPYKLAKILKNIKERKLQEVK